MINMSQPIHKKYNVAITKQLGRYMEAIVVDTESTARQCIQYLKVRSTIHAIEARTANSR